MPVLLPKVWGNGKHLTRSLFVEHQPTKAVTVTKHGHYEHLDWALKDQSPSSAGRPPDFGRYRLVSLDVPTKIEELNIFVASFPVVKKSEQVEETRMQLKSWTLTLLRNMKKHCFKMSNKPRQDMLRLSWNREKMYPRVRRLDNLEAAIGSLVDPKSLVDPFGFRWSKGSWGLACSTRKVLLKA